MNVEIQPGFQNLTVVYLPQVDESRLRVYYLDVELPEVVQK